MNLKKYKLQFIIFLLDRLLLSKKVEAEKNGDTILGLAYEHYIKSLKTTIMYIQSDLDSILKKERLSEQIRPEQYPGF